MKYHINTHFSKYPILNGKLCTGSLYFRIDSLIVSESYAGSSGDSIVKIAFPIIQRPNIHNTYTSYAPTGATLVSVAERILPQGQSLEIVNI